MRIKIQQFLFGKCHSWAIVGQCLGRALLNLGHEVDFISTDGFEDKYCPDDLRPYVKLAHLKRKDQKELLIETASKLGPYDCQISYTAPLNWPTYLASGNQNRFGIWNYEYNSKGNAPKALLQGFSKYHHSVDYVLPSSYFTKEVFTNIGIPSEHMVVIPHGINLGDFKVKSPWPLNTKRRRKILLNIAQPHRRKNLPAALAAFGKAFTQNDDVCLVAKVFKQNHAGQQFDVDFNAIYKTFERKYPKHAEVEFVYDYVPNIADIYQACDINFSGTYAECWHLPSLEALAAGIVNVVPNYGGQLDFCNETNSLLINGRIVRAPRDHQYWTFNPFAVHFEIDTNDAAKKLQTAVYDYDNLRKKFLPNMTKTVKKFTWKNAAKSIIKLCK